MSSSPDGPTVLLEWDGPVLVITLNRPQVANALDPETLSRLESAWEEAAADACRAVVLTGAGRNFCAGADLAAARDRTAEMNLRRAFHPQYLGMAALDKPVVAAVRGAAAGGGLGIALGADIRILAADARLVPAWVQIGLVPDLGASWFATRQLGVSVTFDWFATGEPMLADRALQLGLANEVVAPERTLTRAIEKAHLLADQPGWSVRLTKVLLRQAHANSLAEQLEAEIRLQAVAREAPDRDAQVSARMARFAGA